MNKFVATAIALCLGAASVAVQAQTAYDNSQASSRTQ